MSGNLARQISEIQQEITEAAQAAAEWCPACGHGEQVLVLMDDEPEPWCDTCNRSKARGEGIRIIHMVGIREDGPQ